MKIKLLLGGLMLGFVVALAGCGDENTDIKGGLITQPTKAPEQEGEATDNIVRVDQLAQPEEGEEIAIMKTSKGDIKIRLFPEAAPKAVENFVTHSKDGYYDGLTFHRVIKNFMIQTGDPKGTGTGGESIWGAPFEGEFDNNLLHFRGALSMANPGNPNANGSQFFIVQRNVATEGEISTYQPNLDKEMKDKYIELGGTPHLDRKHSIFAQVFEGMDVVDSISGVEVDENDKPLEGVIINKIEITEYKSDKK